MFPVAENDRLESGCVLAGTIEAVDYQAARVRVRTGELVTAWIPWCAMAAGEVRHWRPPSVGEQAVVLSPSGAPELAFAVVGFYTAQHKQANDNRKQITATDWPDNAREHYDHDAHDHRHFWPPAGHSQHTVGGTTKLDIWKGKVVINVEGGSVLTMTPGVTILKTPLFLVDAPLTEFTGMVQIDSLLHVCADTIVDGNVIIGGSDIASGAQIDGGGNTNHHSHSVAGVSAGVDVVKTLPIIVPPPVLPPPPTPQPPTSDAQNG